jgi:PAS domain S-box-containing protein
MKSDLLYRLQGISLKWKLLIPFLLFSFLGISTLAYIGLNAQETLIKKEERKSIRNYYMLFSSEVRHRLSEAMSSAAAVASIPSVPPLVAAKDRNALSEILSPIYSELYSRRGVRILHVHAPPGKSLLRIHLPSEFGESLSHRKTIEKALLTGQPAGGLEWGKAGLGIRGVAPVTYKGDIVGTIEVGFLFDKNFLDELKELWGPDFTEMEKGAGGTYAVRASTLPEGAIVPFGGGLPALPGSEPDIYIAPTGYENRSVLIGLFRDSAGDPAGIVRIDIDRSNILAQLVNTRLIMIVAGVLGCIISSILIWVVAILFLRPIEEIVKESREIALGLRKTLLGRRPSDEIGALTRSLNTMLVSLQDKQRQIEDYARTLELRVQERTQDLVRSEEKYRTLVENLPLIVYRLQLDGTTEFVNPYFTEVLGFTPEEVASDRNFWRTHICGKEKGSDNILEDCWEDDEGFRRERTVVGKDGKRFIFIDHSIPCVDSEDRITCIDGIMVDITELKRLQERELRAEELRVLGGISERFAHELRNPLASAGGFARRLRDSLPQEGNQRRFAEIIVEEVARLEEIVRLMLSAVKPVVLCYGTLNIKEMLHALVEGLQGLVAQRGVVITEKMGEDLPESKGDATLLFKALETIAKNAVLTMEKGGSLTVAAWKQDDHIMIFFSYPCSVLSREDIAQYFFPRVATRPGTLELELPLSKVIIHRHGGKIDVSMDVSKNINISIELPTLPPVSGNATHNGFH